ILALYIQEYLWSFGRWKNANLTEYLNGFKPDIIFFPCFQVSYPHKVLRYIQKKTGAKVVLFHADDYLTKESMNVNWFQRLYRRRKAKIIRTTVINSSLNYCISSKQKEEYEKILSREMKILYKGLNFSSSKPVNREKKDVIRMVYIGSTLYGRWKTLGYLANAIYNINKKGGNFQLLIYSQYEPTKKTLDIMEVQGASKYMGSLHPSQVKEKMLDADIVLHVESFDKDERKKTRLSFSTKIVDCLHSGRAIMAIGGEEAASIDYLVENDAAI